MRDQARVVVIGGGIVGCSVLYHLAKLGWSDVVLVEKTELTAGSTWHAAGLLPLFNMSYSVGQLHKYSIDLYQQLEAETGQAVSFHRTGNLRLATNRERMDEYRNYCGTANTIGVPFELIGPNEIGALWPLCNLDGLVGALFHPHDGHVAPVDVTQALAKGARDRGAEINRNTEVTAIQRTRAGEWLVKTARGDIRCETVVTATGSWARQVGAMVGLDLPTIPVEHQYLVTDTIPELEERKAQGLPEMPVLRESDASYYMREERQGLILGPYEKDAPGLGGGRCAGGLWAGAAAAGCGPPRAPYRGRDQPRADVRPRWDQRLRQRPDPLHARRQPAHRPGLRPPQLLAGGGLQLRHHRRRPAAPAGSSRAGSQTASPPSTCWRSTPAAFGAYANKNYTTVKNEEAYAPRLHHPLPGRGAPGGASGEDQPLPRAARGPRRGLGASATAGSGPNWFAPEGTEGRDEWSFRRTNYFEPVGAECRAVRERAGLIDITSFSKFRVSGPAAETALDRVLANRLPQAAGRIKLAHALTATGGVRSEFHGAARGA